MLSLFLCPAYTAAASRLASSNATSCRLVSRSPLRKHQMQQLLQQRKPGSQLRPSATCQRTRLSSSFLPHMNSRSMPPCSSSSPSSDETAGDPATTDEPLQLLPVRSPPRSTHVLSAFVQQTHLVLESLESHDGGSLDHWRKTVPLCRGPKPILTSSRAPGTSKHNTVRSVREDLPRFLSAYPSVSQCQVFWSRYRPCTTDEGDCCKRISLKSS